jgi:hypothetical protein
VPGLLRLAVLGLTCAHVIEAQEQENEYPQCLVKSSGDSDPPHLEVHASFGNGFSPFDTLHVQMGSEFFPGSRLQRKKIPSNHVHICEETKESVGPKCRAGSVG